MSPDKKVKLYNWITIFCVVICMLLIGRVASDELVGRREERSVHTPPEITYEGQTDSGPQGQEGTAIDEETLEQEINKYLPDGFPLEDISFDISEDGTVRIDAKASKSKLKDYMEEAGIELKGVGLGFSLLPGKIDVSLCAVCSCDEESGMLSVSLSSLEIAGTEIELSEAAQSSFSELSKSLNKILIASGVTLDVYKRQALRCPV